MTKRLPRKSLSAFLLLLSLIAPAALALEPAQRQAAETAIKRGIAYLRTAQRPDGSWSPDYGPAITALCLVGMLDDPSVDQRDPSVAKALPFVVSSVRPDGSIHQGILASYNTAISVSALSRLEQNAATAKIIADALDHLRRSQWQTGQPDPQGNPVDPSHPYYGGIGYGKHGRPDMSNTHFMIQAFEDAGVDCKDPAIQRALVFLNRCQATDENDLFDAETVVRDGGFIYATSVNQDAIGVPESKANQDMIDEAKAGRPVSGLRSYGSITYAGFKSYVYAELEADDPRVSAAYDWVKSNYTLKHNPGMPPNARQQGYFYYCMTFGKALNAWGEPQIPTHHDGPRNWAHDLIDALTQRQNPDGSWTNPENRWLEDDPNLATAYALIALNNALGR